MRVEPLVGKQLLSVQLTDARLLMWEGAVRSSKTICSLLTWLDFIRNGPAGPLLMAGRTERTLIRNLLDPLVDMIGNRRCRIVHGSGTAHIMGRKVYLVGANDERSQEKIRGLTLAGGYADELSTLPESFWTMFLTRLSVPGAKAFASSNPEGPRHWMKVNFLNKARLHVTRDGQVLRRHCAVCGNMRCTPGCEGDGNLDLARFSFQLADNPTLPPEYVLAINAEHQGLWRRRLVLGEWCRAEGVVYDMFDTARHVVDDVPPVERWLAVGVDVGTTNPFHAVLIAIATDPATDRPALYVVGEYRYDSRKTNRQMTDEQYSRAFREWLAGLDISGSQVRGVVPEWVIVDPAATSFRVQLHRDGMQTRAADNAVLDGIRTVASLLSLGKLKIHRSCRHLLDEMHSYSWDPKRAEKGEDVPLKIDDHGADALRYALRTTRGIWRTYLSDVTED